MSSPAPFISRQDLSDYLGRDVSADDGALIALDAACDAVRTISEQEFNLDTSVVVLDGTGTDALLLPQLPVVNAGTVEVAGEAVDDYALNSELGVLFRTAGTATDPTTVSALRWPEGRQNVSVTYEHGYEDEDIPRDVRMVALSIASRLVVQGVAQSESLGGVSMSYAIAASDFSNGELAIMRKHRPR